MHLRGRKHAEAGNIRYAKSTRAQQHRNPTKCTPSFRTLAPRTMTAYARHGVWHQNPQQGKSLQILREKQAFSDKGCQRPLNFANSWAQPSSSPSSPAGRFRGPQRPPKHKDLTVWFQGPIYGGYRKSWFVGALCLYTLYHVEYTTYHILYTLCHIIYTMLRCSLWGTYNWR